MTFVFALLTVAFGAWFVRSFKKFKSAVNRADYREADADRAFADCGLSFVGFIISLIVFGATFTN